MNNAHNVKLITNNQGNTVSCAWVLNAFAIPLHLWGLLNAVLEFSNTVFNNPYKCKGIAIALVTLPGKTALARLSAINFNLIALFA